MLIDIMVPRNEIVGIDINDDWKSIVRQLTHSPHGRIVPDNLIARHHNVVNADLLKVQHRQQHILIAS
jgi:Mg2+/Co2+ transporter CorC